MLPYTESNMSYKSIAVERPDRYKISVEEYIHYQSKGYLVVPKLVAQEEVGSLLAHGMDILEDRVAIPGLESLPTDATRAQRVFRRLLSTRPAGSS